MNIVKLIHRANSVKREALLTKAGGRPAQEGEVRVRKDGSKWRKVGNTWEQVVQKKEKKSTLKEGPKSKKQEQETKGQSKVEEVQISKLERAQLLQMKKILDTDKIKAYEIFQSLSPEVQEKVPQQIVNSLVEESIKDEKSEKDSKERT